MQEEASVKGKKNTYLKKFGFNKKFGFIYTYIEYH